MKKYVDELYQWISSLYDQTVSGQISEEEYKEHLKYYNDEVERVNKLRMENKPKKKGISPELIEKFFAGSNDSFSKSISIAANFREVERNSRGKPFPKRVRTVHHYTPKEEQEVKERIEEDVDPVSTPMNRTTHSPIHPSSEVKADPPSQRPVPQFPQNNGSDVNERRVETDLNQYKVLEPTPLGKVEQITDNDKKKYVRYNPVSDLSTPQGGGSTVKEIPTGFSKAANISKPISASDKVVRKVTSEVVDNLLKTKTSDQRHLNIVLLGNSSVGRTSIRRALMGKNFIKQHLSTVGASMDEKTLEIDGSLIRFTIMDLGGQDFYASVRANFYRNIDGAIIVFDLSDKSSFIQLDKWLLELYQNTKDRAIPFILVGNKTDLKRKVKKEDAIKLAENLSDQVMKYGFRIPYLEVSAKKNEGIITIFETIARSILALG